MSIHVFQNSHTHTHTQLMCYNGSVYTRSFNLLPTNFYNHHSLSSEAFQNPWPPFSDPSHLSILHEDSSTNDNNYRLPSHSLIALYTLLSSSRGTRWWQHLSGSLRRRCHKSSPLSVCPLLFGVCLSITCKWI